MNTILQTTLFHDWLAGLKDARAKAAILLRIDRAALGNFGDCEPVARGVYEMRVHFGPGYRIYYVRRSKTVYLLLCGGSKRTQGRIFDEPSNWRGICEDGTMTKAKPKARRGRKVEVVPFDAAEFLDSREAIAEYMDAAIRDPNPDVFLRAMANVARAKGIASIAERAGVGRESLYKTLAPGASPKFKTIRKLLDAMDVRITVEA